MKKKILSVLLIGILVIGLTGCGAAKEKEVKEQTLVCTTTESDEDMEIEQVISMTYKNDKLKQMKMEVNTKLNNPDIKENWEAFKKSMDENNEEFEKEGIISKVVVNEQNYEYNTILDIDFDKASEEDLKEQGFDGLKDEEGTLEESKESAEKDGATCIIK